MQTKGLSVREADQATDWDVWAKYYDLTDGDRKAMIAFYQSLVKDNVRAILELASGTGRVASALTDMRDDARVVGIDESPTMIELSRAREKRCTWILGDMKKPQVDGPFDLVVCCYNSIQHMLTDDHVLELFGNVKQLLNPGGVFAFDLYEPNLAYLSVNQVDRFVRSTVDESGRRIEIREDTHFDPASRVYTLYWRLVGEGCESPLAHLRYRYRQYTSADIDALLSLVGLSVLARYGDFDRSPVSEMAKKQVVLVGR
jgi:SAM-dependent methyltransferase